MTTTIAQGSNLGPGRHLSQKVSRPAIITQRPPRAPFRVQTNAAPLKQAVGGLGGTAEASYEPVIQKFFYAISRILRNLTIDFLTVTRPSECRRKHPFGGLFPLILRFSPSCRATWYPTHMGDVVLSWGWDAVMLWYKHRRKIL